MKLLSLQVGRPRTVRWRGKAVTTGIYKEPVEGRLMLQLFNLEGDEQADLTVHGGRNKAVYVYPSEHYPFWREEYPDLRFTHGWFGENFTTEGLDERTVRIGDRFRIGTALVVVTQPRMPCFKLGIRLGKPDGVKRFHASGRCGFYLGVLQEGEVGAGDLWEQVSTDEAQMTVIDSYRLMTQ
jgi:MOSC domain-containing protein YiiM